MVLGLSIMFIFLMFLAVSALLTIGIIFIVLGTRNKKKGGKGTKRIIGIAMVSIPLLLVACVGLNFLCAKDELEGHQFSSSNNAIVLSFGEYSNVTLTLTNHDTNQTSDTDMIYRIEGNDLFLYDSYGILRITATIKEDGKLISITRFVGVNDLSNFSSPDLYREDVKDEQESLESGNTSSVLNPQYGSFTVDKTFSYDGKYYALISEDEQMIVITLYSSNDNEVFSFKPCRKSDFWGICWENDSYNLWIQSGDIGIKCYVMADEVWSVNEDAIRPDYIISKYDN